MNVKWMSLSLQWRSVVFQEREAIELEISQKQLPTALSFSHEGFLRNLLFDRLSSSDYCTNAGAAATAAHPDVRQSSIS